MRVLKIAALLCCAAAICWGIFEYQGNILIFSGFSAVICAIAYCAVRFWSQYAHLFLGVAWFIGFLVKYAFHHATGVSYLEPYGSFDGSAASWDAVLLVVTVGSAGYLVGRLVALPFVGSLTDRLFKQSISVPARWSALRTPVWLLAALLVMGSLIINHEMGLLVRGYVARVVLPWPFGGLFSWMSDIGLALMLSLLLAWDRQAGFGIVRGFFALCVEGALLSISTLSRGVYFFHTIPPLVTESMHTYRVKSECLRCCSERGCW